MSNLKRKLRRSFHQQERNEVGKYVTECGCLMHHEWSAEHLYEVFNIKKSKKFGNKVINQMKNDGYLLKQGNNLCNACYASYKNDKSLV